LAPKAPGPDFLMVSMQDRGHSHQCPTSVGCLNVLQVFDDFPLLHFRSRSKCVLVNTTDSGDGELGQGGGTSGSGIRRQERLLPSLQAEPLPSSLRRNTLSITSSPRNHGKPKEKLATKIWEKRRTDISEEAASTPPGTEQLMTKPVVISSC